MASTSNVRAVIAGIAHYVPDKILTNSDLERIVDTSDEWITQRVGIKERRISSENETTSVLAIQASKKALEKAHMDPSELDLIICATVTGDMLFPSTSCLIQHQIGAKNAAVFDVGAACAGFVYALSIASAMTQIGQAKKILVIGADSLTKFVDWSDRSTCVLFGDGAAAAIITAQENTDRGIIHTVLKADGAGACHVNIQAGGSACPAHSAHASTKNKYIQMAGQEVYRFAVSAMPNACFQVLEEAGYTPDEVDLFVPHQANARIIDSAIKKMQIPNEKVFLNVERYGNTSAASIPIALSEAVEQGRLKEGMLVLSVGFGAGLVWGANLIRW